MTIYSHIRKDRSGVEVVLEVDREIISAAEAETMIAQFQDVMEDFFRVWPELREEHENGLI